MTEPNQNCFTAIFVFVGMVQQLPLPVDSRACGQASARLVTASVRVLDD